MARPVEYLITSSPWAVALSWQDIDISKMTYKQTDLVSGLQSQFISRSVQGRLEVFKCLHGDCELCHLA